MINHARTLLLNRDSSLFPGYDFPGEHVVPDDYKALELPGYLNRARSVLFGGNPDRAMLNYRLNQFMQLLHATEYTKYITNLDSRITYLDPARRELFSDDLFTPVANQLAGATADVYLQGEQEAPDAHGRLHQLFDMEITGATTVRVKQYAPQQKTTDYDVTFSGGLSNRIPLGSSGWGVLLGSSQVGAKWQFNFYMRPSWSLGQVAIPFRSIGEPTLNGLFGITNEEPYKTFRNLWYTHLDTPLALTGLLLAVIYRTEEVRTNG